ncbi:EF-hand domain-containing protein [Hirschfeldia incana]|nr:EF-hand domain-containing protein [Hirschfeldia incana]
MAASSSLPHFVFPSFHGPDVRKGILSHLHIVFAMKKITVFKDQEMDRCQPIGSALIQAIREAKASIVLISKNYASSRCCLDELLEILRCKEFSGQIVMPVFYDVDPSDVRAQKGDFGIIFKTTCQGATEEQKRRWIEALTCVATISGEHSRNCADEAAMLEKVSTVMLYKLKMEKLKVEFRIHDLDQNGFITKEELQYVIRNSGVKVTDKQVRKIIKAADADHDGRISYDEFVKFIEKIDIENVRWWEISPQKLHCHGRKRDKFFNFLSL